MKLKRSCSQMIETIVLTEIIDNQKLTPDTKRLKTDHSPGQGAGKQSYYCFAVVALWPTAGQE